MALAWYPAQWDGDLGVATVPALPLQFWYPPPAGPLLTRPPLTRTGASDHRPGQHRLGAHILEAMAEGGAADGGAPPAKLDPELHAQARPTSVLVDLHQQHKQMMRDFVFGLVKLLQPCADGLSHNAVQRCGLMQRSFAIGRLRHADTVLVPPVPSTEDAPRSASRQAGTSPRAEIEVGRDRRLVR